MKHLTTSRLIGMINLSVFSAMWLIYPLVSTGGAAFYVALGLLVLSVVGVLYGATALARMPQRGSAPAATMRQFNKVVGYQWLTIGVVVVGLIFLRQPQLIAFGVMIVVGLHFIPLARIFKLKLYYITAAAVVVIGLGGAIVSLTHPESTAPPPLPFLATSAILLVTAALQSRH